MSKSFDDYIQAQCPQCNRSLYRNEWDQHQEKHLGDCRACHGTGWYTRPDSNRIGSRGLKCMSCGGSGRREDALRRDKEIDEQIKSWSKK